MTAPLHLQFEDPFTDERVAYQRDAITAVTDLFRGQEICRTEFTVTRRAGASTQGALDLDEAAIG